MHHQFSDDRTSQRLSLAGIVGEEILVARRSDGEGDRRSAKPGTAGEHGTGPAPQSRHSRGAPARRATTPTAELIRTTPTLIGHNSDSKGRSQTAPTKNATVNRRGGLRSPTCGMCR